MAQLAGGGGYGGRWYGVARLAAVVPMKVFTARWRVGGLLPAWCLGTAFGALRPPLLGGTAGVGGYGMPCVAE